MPTLKYKNTGTQASAKNGQVMREVTQAEGWDIPYACENGICGTCIVKITQGKEHLAEMEEQEKQTLQALGVDDGDHRLACQCKMMDGDIEIQH